MKKKEKFFRSAQTRVWVQVLSEMVRERGLEPLHLAAYAPQAYVSTNFTTRALYDIVVISQSRRQKL